MPRPRDHAAGPPPGTAAHDGRGRRDAGGGADLGAALLLGTVPSRAGSPAVPVPGGLRTDDRLDVLDLAGAQEPAPPVGAFRSGVWHHPDRDLFAARGPDRIEERGDRVYGRAHEPCAPALHAGAKEPWIQAGS